MMMNSASQTDNLLNTLYDLTLDPLLFEQFTGAWDRFIQEDLDGVASKIEESIEQHFERAFLIIEKMGRSITMQKPLTELVVERQVPCVGIDKRGIVLSANALSVKLLTGLRERNSFWDVINEKSLESLQEAVQQVVVSAVAVPVLVLLKDKTPSLFVLRKVADTEQILIDISSYTWTKEATAFLQHTYQFTDAEINVAKLLYQGLSIQQIAKLRNRATETIRKHLSALMSKTDSHTQAHLMRLLTGVNFIRQPTEQLEWFTNTYTLYKQRLTDGRNLSYYDTGGSSDKVMIVMHPFLRTPELPSIVKDSLCNQGYRIIGICRAGYGESSVALSSRNLLNGAADDLNELLKALGINKIDLLGLMGGAIHCYHIASLYPKLVKQIFNISGTVPIIKSEQLKEMPASTRAIAFTARKFPKLFPLLARAGVALVDSGNANKLINSLYRNSPADLNVAKREEVKQWIVRGCQFTVHQGGGAWVNELSQVAELNFDYFTDVKCPVSLLHSEQDSFVSFESVAELCAGLNNFKLVSISNSCHLLLFDRPEIVAVEIEKCLQYEYK